MTKMSIGVCGKEWLEWPKRKKKTDEIKKEDF